MTEIIKETVTTRDSNQDSTSSDRQPNQATRSQTVSYLIYFFFGLLDVLLLFRLVLKLMGASTSSDFVRIIYSVTSLFIMPFEGIFRRGFTQGIETTAVLEPATLVAIVVYAFLAWGIIKLFLVLSGEKQDS